MFIEYLTFSIKLISWTDDIVRVAANRWVQAAGCRQSGGLKGRFKFSSKRLLAYDNDDDNA